MKTISRDELKLLIDNKENYVLIDVREKNEIQAYGAIPTSHNVPLSEFEEAWELDEKEFKEKYKFKVTKEDRIICYCRSGGRSMGAVQFLNQLGYKAENYLGSALEWSEIDPNVKAY